MFLEPSVHCTFGSHTRLPLSVRSNCLEEPDDVPFLIIPSSIPLPTPLFVWGGPCSSPPNRCCYELCKRLAPLIGVDGRAQTYACYDNGSQTHPSNDYNPYISVVVASPQTHIDRSTATKAIFSNHLTWLLLTQRFPWLRESKLMEVNELFQG